MHNAQDHNAVYLPKDGHVYLVLYRDGQERDARRALVRWAEDDWLNFDYHDAAMLRQQINDMACEGK
jgi:hypothetical protein